MSKLVTLTVAGRDYGWVQARVTGVELREMHRKYKLTLKTLMPAVAECDPDALTCFWWLLVRQNGRDYDSVPLNDDLDYPAGALLAALFELVEDEPEEAEPDPTRASSSPTDSTASPEPSTPTGTTLPPHGSQLPTGSSSGSSTATTSG